MTTVVAASGAVDPVNLANLARRLWPWLAAILTGLMGAACFPPFEQNWLAWVALTPLISAVWFSGKNSRRPWLRNALLGYVSGLVFFTLVFSWLGSLGSLFDNFFLHSLSLLLSLYLGLHWAFWAWFVGLISPSPFTSSWRNLLSAFLGASAWVAHEWLRGWLFGGFGWNGLGASQHGHLMLIQVAEFTGVGGLSFLIAFANVIAVTLPPRLFTETRTHQMRPHWDLNLTILAVFGLMVLGWNAQHQGPPSSSTSVRVAAIQPNVPQKEKLDPSASRHVFDQLTRLSEPLIQSSRSPQLIVWPESAMPGPMMADEQSYRFVMDFSAAAHADLLLGSDVFEDDQSFNGAYLVPANGGPPQTYRKIHLVPFGEYVPLRHSFPPFAAIAGRWVPGDFAAGREYSRFTLTTADIRVAPLICFEDTIGELVREFVRPNSSGRGADLLINMTNDGWFLESAGSQQHVNNAIFRCVETRRPMVRAANTGVTCVINEFGRVTQSVSDGKGHPFGEGSLIDDVKVPTDGRLTFYVRHGDLFGPIGADIAGLTILAIFGLKIVRRARLKERRPLAAV